ncbi:MAG: CBS domain-containing protein [Bacteroidia bacterium]|nr:CBS domain-containing protein [Bacteroidia bacterium]
MLVSVWGYWLNYTLATILQRIKPEVLRSLDQYGLSNRKISLIRKYRLPISSILQNYYLIFGGATLIFGFRIAQTISVSTWIFLILVITVWLIFRIFSDYLATTRPEIILRWHTLWIQLQFQLLFPLYQLYKHWIQSLIPNPKSVKLVIEDFDVSEQDEQILKNAKKLESKTVSVVMRHRPDIFAVPDHLSEFELIQHIQQQKHTRIPVYHQKIDNIKGILYVSDLVSSENKSNWQKLIKPAFLVPEMLRLQKLLEEFRIRNESIALVVDEYGSISGLVTLQDVLAEFLGSFSTETNTFQHRWKQLDHNQWEMEATITLDAVCSVLGLEDCFLEKYQGENDTLGGMLTAIHGKIPEPGTQIQLESIIFTIHTATPFAIQTVLVTSL